MQGFLITLVFALLCTPSGLFLLENFNFNKDFRENSFYFYIKVLVQKGDPKTFKDDALFLRIFIIIHLVVDCGGG